MQVRVILIHTQIHSIKSHTLFSLNVLVFSLDEPPPLKRPATESNYLDSALVQFWQNLCDQIEVIFEDASATKLASPTNSWYLIPSKILYVRDCYKRQLALFKQARDSGIANFLYIGTSGIGKSAYLIFLMASLVHEAKLNGTRITILFCKYREKPYLLNSDGSVVIYGGDGVDYHFSDSVDIDGLNHISKGAVLVASEKSVEYVRFQKASSSHIFLPPMEVWTFDELIEITPEEYCEAERLLRYAIFGGSARNYLAFEPIERDITDYAFVMELMDLMFTEEKRAIEGNRWNNIFTCIVTRLGNCANQKGEISSSILSSLMWHTNDGIHHFWASTFMRFLGSEIMKREDGSVKGLLKSIIGGAGMGFLFEYMGHRKLLSGSKDYTIKELGTGKRQGRIKITIPALTLQKIRTVADIGGIQANCYGMPIASNFPLIDAVIQPDTLLQFTTTTAKHKGASNRLEEIRSFLLGDRLIHKMVFVVGPENKDFSVQEGLGDIKQYSLIL